MDRQPGEKVELHTATVVDARSVAPALAKVDAQLADALTSHSGQAFVPGRRFLLASSLLVSLSESRSKAVSLTEATLS